MTSEMLNVIVAGATIALGTIAPAVAMGMIISKALEAIGRNPETEGPVRTTMVLGVAFVESIAIFALVIALIVKFV